MTPERYELEKFYGLCICVAFAFAVTSSLAAAMVQSLIIFAAACYDKMKSLENMTDEDFARNAAEFEKSLQNS